MGQRVLANHDGIVDDDAQRHDQGEQADHVDAATDGVEHAQRGHERHRDAQRHPPGDPSIEEQKQNGHHQHQTAAPVFDQQENAVLDQSPGLVEDGQFHPRRQLWPGCRRPVFQNPGGLKRIGGLGALQLQLHCRAAMEAQSYFAILGTAFDDGDIAQRDQGAIAAGFQRQRGKSRFVAALIQTA